MVRISFLLAYITHFIVTVIIRFVQREANLAARYTRRIHKPRISDQRCLLFSLQSPTAILSLVNKTERKTLVSTTICLQISLLISN